MPRTAKKARDVEAVAERLTQALDACKPKLTRSQLATRLRVTPGAVSHYLNGNRPCPPEVIEKIARITKVEPGWLLKGVAGNGTHAQASSSAPRRSRAKSLAWGFREAPADGGKDFGNAAVYATPMAVRTVVREDGQNSLDAGRRPEVVLRFRIVELSPDSERYLRVLKALRFEQLRERIHAIEEAEEFESKLGTKLSAGLEHVLDEKLVLLYVDDYGTRGLPGDEFDSTKPFCALVRDNLNSRKETQMAGGVFGVGAKVNIACSRLSTVVFASKVEGEESRGTRLIGRTEMTYHELREGRSVQRFAGPGWLGERARQPGVVPSAWLDDDDQLLDDLMLRRDQLPRGIRKADSAGTSIMVVGFADPQLEAGASTQQLVDTFVEAAAVNFWPAMMRGGLTVWVERYVDDEDEPVRREQVDPRQVAGVTELCDAWDKHFSGKSTPVLSAPGDVASIPIQLMVPATRQRARGVKAHDEVTAECQLLVRLSDPEGVSGDPRAGQIAYVRGRAMVTRYQSRGSVVGGRPFHAALIAGTLVGRSAEQVAAEQFLRIAEPPAHDKWAYNADLGERYARGAKKALDELHARVTEELQKILRPSATRSGDGPEVLKRLLQIRPPKVDAPKQPQVRILRSTAKVVDGAWRVEAELSINPTSRTLQVSPRLSFRCEGGPPIPVSWSRVEVDEEGVEVIENKLILKPRLKRVTFRAWSDPASHPVDARESSALLDVIARVEAEL
jgi:RNA polymerase primary sigma factor